MLKFATTQILGTHLDGQKLPRTAHRHTFEYEARPGYLYVRSRAISSRCNENWDEFPAEEIKQAYATFIGKPVFVNHVNDDHRRARGVIIDAALHEDLNEDGSPDTWAEVLQEVDAHRFPRLAKAILDGHINQTSMGCDVEYSICSACGNRATTPAEYCQHIPRAKGQRVYRHTASGQRVGKLIYESCYGLGFFENSLLVEPPADPTALFLGVDASGLDKKADKDPRFAEVGLGQDDDGHFVKTHRSHSDSYPSLEEIPQDVVDRIASTGARKKLAYGETRAPQDVDTLREDTCPVCGDGDTYDGEQCRICGFISPPEQFRDPDLDAAKRMDLRKQVVDPSLIDDNGVLTEVGDGSAMPGEADPNDPRDPLAAPETELPVDPSMIGADGQVTDDQQQPEALDGAAPGAVDAGGDGMVQPGQIGPDGAVIPPEGGGQAAPRELPYRAQDHTGDAFTQGPDMPDVPEPPDGPGEFLEDQGLNEDQAMPGTPGDGVPDLLCPSCGFMADATAPTSQNMGDPMAAADGTVAGDVCPNCSRGQLLTPGELGGEDSVPPPVRQTPRA